MAINLSTKIGKKEVYPSKKTLNLYYRDEKSSKSSTVMLYILLGMVLVLAAGKFLVYDLLVELDDAKDAYEAQEMVLNEYYEKLTGYQDVKAKHNRYSYGYLKDSEIICDRMEVITMLEDTVFSGSVVTQISISDETIVLGFEGMNLQETAVLGRQLEAYDIVETVTVTTATLSKTDNTYYVRMTVTLINPTSTDTAGGES